MMSPSVHYHSSGRFYISIKGGLLSAIRKSNAKVGELTQTQYHSGRSSDWRERSNGQDVLLSQDTTPGTRFSKQWSGHRLQRLKAGITIRLQIIVTSSPRASGGANGISNQILYSSKVVTISPTYYQTEFRGASRSTMATVDPVSFAMHM